MTVPAAVRHRMETLRTLFAEAPKEARTYLAVALVGAQLVEAALDEREEEAPEATAIAPGLPAALGISPAQLVRDVLRVDWSRITPPDAGPASSPEAAGEAGQRQPEQDPGAQRVEAPPTEAGTPAATLPPLKWTEQRKNVLREMYPRGDPSAAIADAVNALPGEPATPRQCVVYAASLGLRRPAPPTSDAVRAQGDQESPAPPEAAPAEAAPRIAALPAPRTEELTPEQQTALADAAMERTQDKAREMLRKGSNAGAVQMHTKLPLREVIRLQREVAGEAAAP